MNKQDLIDAIAKNADLTKADSGRALDAAVEAIMGAVAKGDPVQLVGFGTFKSVKRAARSGRNPASGAAMKIPAKVVPKFTFGAVFKTKVAGGKAAK